MLLTDERHKQLNIPWSTEIEHNFNQVCNDDLYK